MGVGGQRHAPAALHTRKRPGTHMYRRLGGPQGRSGWVQIISPPPGFDRVRSETLNFHINKYSCNLGYENKKLVFVSDTRSDDWFLMNSVWAPLSVVAFYLYFVFNLGPRLMKNRRPMQLDTVIKIYDIIQVISNSYIAERVRNT
jgi:hypothetical protein